MENKVKIRTRNYTVVDSGTLFVPVSEQKVTFSLYDYAISIQFDFLVDDEYLLELNDSDESYENNLVYGISGIYTNKGPQILKIAQPRKFGTYQNKDYYFIGTFYTHMTDNQLIKIDYTILEHSTI